MISGTLIKTPRRLQSDSRLLPCFALVLSVFWSGLAAAADLSLDELMKLLAEQKSARATFVENKYMGVITKPLESSGELFFSAPDRLEKRTLKPKQEVLTLEGDKLTFSAENKRTVTVSLQEHPEVAAIVESVRGTLSGDMGALQKNYSVELSGTAMKWQLSLLPSQANVSKYIKRIRIKGTQSQLKVLELEQSDGDRVEMLISALAVP